MRSKQVLRALALPLMLSSLNHLSPYRFNSDRRGNSRRISEMWLSFSFASFVSAVVYRVIVISVVWSEHSKQLFNGKCKWTEFSSGRSVPIYSLSAILIDSHTLVLFFFFFSIRFFGSKWNPLCWNFTPANPMRATWIKKPEVASHFPRCRRSWWCSLGQFQSASLAALEAFALTSFCCFFSPLLLAPHFCLPCMRVCLENWVQSDSVWRPTLSHYNAHTSLWQWIHD